MKNFNKTKSFEDLEQAIEQAHLEYEREKKSVIVNLKGLKVFYKQLYKNEVICKDCYKGLNTIVNNTIKFINEKEI